MILKYILQKEVLQLKRNPFLPKMIVIFPIMIMCVMPWVMNMEISNVVVEVVDNDHSTLSRQLVDRIGASTYFKLGGTRDSYAEALNDIENFDADVVVEIPRGFGKKHALGQNAQVLVAANAVNGTKGSMGSSYMASIVTQHVAPSVQALQQRVSVIYLYNRHLNYKLFMIPSLTAILVMLICGFLPALNIVGEKEKGTIEAINVTPVGKYTFILGKLIPYWVMSGFVLTICLLLAWAVYGITPAGNIGLIYLLALLLGLFFSGFGLVISNCNETMQQAVFVMWFFVMCMMLLSGLFTPVRSMPSWAYLTTYINPLCYFIDAVRTVFVRGGGIGSISHQLIVLAGFATALSLLAVATYRKNSK